MDLDAKLGFTRFVTEGASGGRVAAIVVHAVRFQEVGDALGRDVVPWLPCVVFSPVAFPFDQEFPAADVPASIQYFVFHRNFFK